MECGRKLGLSKIKVLLVLFAVLIFVQGLNVHAQEASTLRKERFDNILPQAMRDNQIDMWIHVIVGEDPLDLGAGSGYCVFTDRGGDRIERAVFDYNYEVRDPEIYDIIGDEGNSSGTGLGLESRFEGLGEFVAERDPERIVVSLDSISYTDYNRLANRLGDKYAKRIASAENLIAAFRPREVRGESSRIQKPDAMLNLVRRERFDVTLPQIMWDNKIDMWINVLREGDPLSVDLGSNFGYCVFTDRGVRRIERAIFDCEVQDPGAYDIIGGDGPEPDLARRFTGLREFVAERDPKVIGVNFSEKMDLADGISYADYNQLVKALGDTYANKMVSAEFLIIDFLTRRVTSELVLFGRSGARWHEHLQREFAKIVPGVTRLRDVDANAFVRDRDGNEDAGNDYVVQRGDVVGTPGQSGYVLREGETDLPPYVQDIWAHGMKVREIIRDNVKPGPTVRETIDLLERKLEEAGYYHNPVDHWDKDVDQNKTQVHLDLHAWGGHVDIAIPRIAPLSPGSFNEDWAMDLRIPVNHTFTLEYMVHMPVPEWGRGKHIYLPFHDPGVVTERGVEFPYPPVQGILVVQ